MKKRSLLYRLMTVMVIAVLLQLTVGIGMVIALGVVDNQYVTGYENLSYIVEQKTAEIESTFNGISTNLMSMTSDFNSYFNKQMALTNISVWDLQEENTFIESIFLDKSENITNFLYANPNASGFFVIIGDKPIIVGEETTDNACLYIRKKSSQLSAFSAKEYWVLKYGSQRIAEKLNIQFDYLWEYHFHMHATEQNSVDFFNNPLSNATALNNHYFISRPFRIAEGDVMIVTQTMPLVDEEGYAYGVIGVEINLEAIEQLLNSPQLPGVRSGFYSLTDNDRSNFMHSYVNSTPFSNVFLTQENLTFHKIDENTNTIQYRNPKAQFKDVLGTYSKIRLYNNNSPYSNGSYVLYGFVPNSEFLKNADLIKTTIVVLGIVFSCFSLLMAVFVSIYATKPILRLAKQVSETDVDKSVCFQPTGLKEIDQLSQALTVYSTSSLKSASRLSHIIDLFEKPIGGFEEDYEEEKAYVSTSLYYMFSLPYEGRAYIPLSEWLDFKAKTLGETIEGYEDVYLVADDRGALKYVQLNTKEIEGNVFGVITDITEDMLEKKQLAYERDVEPLTKLYNRAAFHKLAQEALHRQPDMISALLFVDIDNLKYINDNYGHECGDKYIVLMAESLRAFELYQSVVARISGDEFAVLLTGFDTQEEAKRIIEDVLEKSKKRTITLPNGAEYKLRCSTGIAWYPKDADNIKQLVKYADFAMYEIKHSNKGESKEFDLMAYNQKSFLTTKLEILNNFIENEMLYFAFQPIVDAKTGRIYAYEALIRSKHRELVSPYQIIQLAKSQSKLYPLERLVTQTAIQYLKQNIESFHEKKLFVKAIQTEALSEEDFQKMKMLGNSEVFSRMVLEISESEHSDAEKSARRMRDTRSLGVEIAIDDFGSGYSNDISIIVNAPDYIKVGMSIVQGIHADDDKKQRLKDLISYANLRGIQIIAEGLETFDDLKALAVLGVDYYQGYLLYKPMSELAEDDPKVISLIHLAK